jgi:membrane protease YdiL (CAAX protease family)
MERAMSYLKAFAAWYSLPVYFVLTFAISWGGFVAAVGPGAFPGTGTQYDPRITFVVTAMLAGPSVAGVLLTALLSGRRGLRELVSRLLKWRVGIRWYVAALLPAPALSAAVLVSQSLPLPVLGPNAAAAVAGGLTAGLAVVFEEIGWTGFAVPRLRRRYSAFTTGVVLGLAWGAWHLLQTLWVAGAYAGEVPLPVFLVLTIVSGIAQLTAFRVLMVWVYDRTGSLLVATLMHGSLSASSIFLFAPHVTGTTFVVCGWIAAAAWWGLVAAVSVVTPGLLPARSQP